MELAAEAPDEVELIPAGEIETRQHDGRERCRNDDPEASVRREPQRPSRRSSRRRFADIN